MLKKSRHLLLLLLLYCLAAPVWGQERQLPVPNSDAFVYFTADNAQVEPNQKKVNLTGNVTLIQKTPDGQKRTVTGENITYDQQNTTISSVGPVTVEDGQGAVLRGENITANYTTKDFSGEHLTTEYPPLRILGAKEISAKDGRYLLRDAEVTCCDCEDPHYTLSVGKLTLSPQKRVFGTNALLRLDGIPVLYLPVFWRSLDSQKPWTTYVDFTQSNKTGFGILTSSVFNPILGLRPVLNVDYYTKSGFGFGAGLTAVTSPTLHGSAEYYYINDHEADKLRLADTKRWGLRGGYWWEIYDSSDHFNNPSGALYQLQTQFRKVSDPYFNDSFFRSNPYIFMPDQETNLSISRQTRRTTLRVNYQEKEIFAWNKQEFMAEKRTLPEIKYALLPFNDPWLKLSHRLEADFNNTSSLQYLNNRPNEEGPYQRQGHARWTTEKSLRLSRTFTFMPSVFYDQKITLDDANYNQKDAWVGRVGTDLNLQTRTTWGTTNLGYQLTKRLSTGTISSDHLSPDKGIERNRLYINHYYRPTFTTHIRLESGFNLSDYTYDLATGYGREITWDHLKERVEPFLLEWGYTSPDGKVNFFIQDQYDLQQKNINFIAQSNFIVRGQHIGLGLNNFADHTDPGSRYTTNADRYTLTTLWGLRPSTSKWQVDLGIDASFFRNSLVGFNKLARVGWTTHDAKLDFTLRHRNDNLSFALRFTVICGTKKDPKQRPEDTYEYPWRQLRN
ncbi:MAG: LPS export ABC transporter periplasmic protein LptC [Elusimicrobiaceae bacterium]|nr:LPS export ABC transporter periplasmic protein LptC [Elusimicrobiaceae bacterium]